MKADYYCYGNGRLDNFQDGLITIEESSIICNQNMEDRIVEREREETPREIKRVSIFKIQKLASLQHSDFSWIGSCSCNSIYEDEILQKNEEINGFYSQYNYKVRDEYLFYKKHKRSTYLYNLK